jgi:hypothetical protein
MTLLAGDTLHITAWQIPTHSLSRPKSVTNTIGRAPFICRTSSPGTGGA